MDFEALHKMCLDCPQDLWELMVRCIQVYMYTTFGRAMKNAHTVGVQYICTYILHLGEQ